MASDIAAQRVLYEIAGMRDLPVVRGVEYSAGEAGPLTLDLYLPSPVNAGAPWPAIVIVLGYRDAGVTTPFGCQFREMGMIVSWAQLFAASGMAGVVYETRDPAADAKSVLAFLLGNGAHYGVDGSRIGVWSSSGNVPVALSLLMDEPVRCGALCYGLMLDLDGADNVAKAAELYHFANPVADRRVEELSRAEPLFIARAGDDRTPGLNACLDAFVNAALRLNLPVTLVNHPNAPHAFDLLTDTAETHETIRAILAFLQANLTTVAAAQTP